MGLGRILLGAALTGSLLFTGCDEHNITGDLDVNIKEDPVGEIVGRVVWDPEKDGIYEGTKAYIGVGSWPGVAGNLLGTVQKTSSTYSGNFSFQDIPTGSYDIYIQKYDQNSEIREWCAKVGTSVLKQQISNLGDIKLINTYIL